MSCSRRGGVGRTRGASGNDEGTGPVRPLEECGWGWQVGPEKGLSRSSTVVEKPGSYDGPGGSPRGRWSGPEDHRRQCHRGPVPVGPTGTPRRRPRQNRDPTRPSQWSREKEGHGRLSIHRHTDTSSSQTLISAAVTRTGEPPDSPETGTPCVRVGRGPVPTFGV